MTDENRCEPPPETPNYVVHVPDDATGIQWRGIRYRLSALTPPATVAALEAEVTALRQKQGSWEDDARVWQAEATRLRSTVAALVEALEGWTNALDAKHEFERQNPGNSTKAWDRLFYAVEAAETEARAALALYREAGR